MVLGEIIKDPLLSTRHERTGSNQCVDFIVCDETRQLRHLRPIGGILSARQSQINQTSSNFIDTVDAESADGFPGLVSRIERGKFFCDGRKGIRGRQ